MRARPSARMHRAARAWSLVLVCAAGCHGSRPATEPDGEAGRHEERALTDAGERPVHVAPPRPDAGDAQGEVPARHELVGVPRPEAAARAGDCPAKTHRCCDGSCSKEKGCPGIACDSGPPMTE